MNDNPISAVVILAAGFGTRMRSQRPKVLHEAGGTSLLNNVIRVALSLVPAEDIVCVTGHGAEEVRTSVESVGIRFADQPEQLGTGHAVRCARSVVNGGPGQLIILNGDGPLLKPETLKSLSQSAQATPSRSSIVTTLLGDPTGYGRIIRDAEGFIQDVVEQKSLVRDQALIREVNPGVYCFDSEPFWELIDELKPDNSAREFYLTDMVGIFYRHGLPVIPYPIEDHTQLLGINTRFELAVADRILRSRKAEELMLSGVTIERPETVTIDQDVQIGPDTVVEANVQLRTGCVIGANCRIGTGSVLRNCSIAANVVLKPYVVAEDSTFGTGAMVGPFSRLRMGAEAAECSYVGNFVELKKTRLGHGSKASHLAYLGDTETGREVNIGAGTITCNYDGQQKHKTKIGDGVFVGSNSTLVAPLALGDDSFIAAGSTVTHNVNEGAMAIARAYQVDKPEWARKRKKRGTSSTE